MTTIAIIGATGSMGTAIAKSLSSDNYRLLLRSTNESGLLRLMEEIRSINPTANLEGVSCAREAGWEADIVILAIPYHAHEEIIDAIREVANQKVVISIANPVNGSEDELVTDPSTSAAEELQKLLPHSKVVKAFNTNFPADFENPIIEGKQVDSFIAGNDPEALGVVSEIVESAGFNPVIAGELPVSRTLENMQLLMMRLRRVHNYRNHAGWQILHH